VDNITGFDAANDSFTFSGLNVAGGHINYLETGSFSGGNQASAYLDGGAGNGTLHIDTNGDGSSDMDINLQNYIGTLHSSNFLVS